MNYIFPWHSFTSVIVKDVKWCWHGWTKESAWLLKTALSFLRKVLLKIALFSVDLNVILFDKLNFAKMQYCRGSNHCGCKWQLQEISADYSSAMNMICLTQCCIKHFIIFQVYIIPSNADMGSVNHEMWNVYSLILGKLWRLEEKKLNSELHFSNRQNYMKIWHKGACILRNRPSSCGSCAPPHQELIDTWLVTWYKAIHCPYL